MALMATKLAQLDKVFMEKFFIFNQIIAAYFNFKSHKTSRLIIT